GSSPDQSAVDTRARRSRDSETTVSGVLLSWRRSIDTATSALEVEQRARVVAVGQRERAGYARRQALLRVRAARRLLGRVLRGRAEARLPARLEGAVERVAQLLRLAGEPRLSRRQVGAARRDVGRRELLVVQQAIALLRVAHAQLKRWRTVAKIDGEHHVRLIIADDPLSLQLVDARLGAVARDPTRRRAIVRLGVRAHLGARAR